MALRKVILSRGTTRRDLSGPNRTKAASLPLTDTTRPFPVLEDFVQYGDGEVSIGEVGPIPCAAVASDPCTTLAALQRRKDEGLMHLPERLEIAVSRALEYEKYVDEING